MENMTSLLSQLLECGYLDTNFLIDLCNNNNIEIDIEDIKSNYGTININTIIYDTIRRIAEMFIEDYRDEISNILEIGDLEEYMSYNDLYEIYTNYMDSHLWFKNDKIQELFEKSNYQA